MHIGFPPRTHTEKEAVEPVSLQKSPRPCAQISRDERKVFADKVLFRIGHIVIEEAVIVLVCSHNHNFMAVFISNQTKSDEVEFVALPAGQTSERRFLPQPPVWSHESHPRFYGQSVH